MTIRSSVSYSKARQKIEGIQSMQKHTYLIKEVNKINFYQIKEQRFKDLVVFN
jgi:hypothetical protein